MKKLLYSLKVTVYITGKQMCWWLLPLLTNPALKGHGCYGIAIFVNDLKSIYGILVSYNRWWPQISVNESPNGIATHKI